MFEKPHYTFKDYFKDGLLETAVVAQVLGLIIGLALVLYGETAGDALVASWLICNTMAFSIKFFGALLYDLFYHRFFQKKYIHTVLWLVSVVCGTLVGSDLGMMLSRILFYSYFPSHFSERYFLNMAGNVFISLVLFVMVAAYVIIKKRLQSKIAENEQILRLQTQSKLAALQSKINPHFLFNTLNAMLSQLKRSPENLETMILHLSDIYREILRRPEDHPIKLQDEMALVKKYLEVEKIRMGDRLDYSVYLEAGLEKVEIPPLLIEPAVENAVIHGIGPKPEGGFVRVEAMNGSDNILIMVTDNGVGMKSKDLKMGYGLHSIQERLKLIYKDKGHFSIIQPKEGGLRIKMEIPHGN